ncbi:chemotaxis protein CheA [uncultured Tateyamaria sp.]|uniref:chemotaxis protein CheA n=1 Tax=uncultured Tateyamaria sp. TaxID=455651 RepID=UPI00263283C0|nr:chemotaxis protein CheA [uncultured Tateyamaria sp.]
MTSSDPMAEIRASFFVECEELLEALQDGLRELDEGTDDGETIHVVFRAVHSIKGGAGAFGFESMVQFAHQYETVLHAVRSGEIAIEPDLLNLFFRATDHLSDLVRTHRDGLDPPKTERAALLGELEAKTGSVPHVETVEEIAFEPIKVDVAQTVMCEDAPTNALTYDIVFAPEPEAFETEHDVAAYLTVLSGLGELEVHCDTSRLPTLNQLVPQTVYLSWLFTLTTEFSQSEIVSVFESIDGACDLQISARSHVNAPEITPTLSVDRSPIQQPRKTDQRAVRSVTSKAVVRVDVDRIERLVNLVGELVINQAMLSQSLVDVGLPPHSDAVNGLEEFQRLTRDIQDSVMMIRAQPVKSLFQRIARIVREASASVSKDVRLVTEGETTELDKTVIERLAEPLTHMIRNAVDHGLEPADARTAVGKPAQGQVRLSAAHKSGRVVINVSDDGRGINRKKVRQIAIDKGLLPRDATLTDAEIDNLLFLPGFSTASDVSDLSGRGVGMDVVRTAIHGLGGRITINSTPNIGTSFSISLPLTLAVLDGMVVAVAGETLVVPLNVVTEAFTLSETAAEQVQPGRFVLRVRDGFVPLFDLGAALGYRPPCDTFINRVALLLTFDDKTRVALVVDEIQDQRQVVIKGLDDSHYRAPGIAAATILGDGQIALILDPADIVANAPKTQARERVMVEA